MTQIDHDGFVQAVGDLLAAWHLPHAAGRTYGQLLLEPAPASLDHLGAVLGLSKGAISTAVRELTSWGLAHTIAQPGSRRLLVEATSGLDTLLQASQDRARMLVRMLQDGEQLTTSPVSAERLRDVTDLFEGYVDAGSDAIRRRHPVPH
ncbi:MAG: transcriptional regulator [Microbacteriaceae bacterium]|nr:transcriptional regulator [Microbacteriaceae bacterium]